MMIAILILVTVNLGLTLINLMFISVLHAKLPSTDNAWEHTMPIPANELPDAKKDS